MINRHVPDFDDILMGQGKAGSQLGWTGAVAEMAEVLTSH